MRWADESASLCSYSDLAIHQCFYAMDIIHQAYDEGYISRSIYIMAISKVKRVMNFDWMVAHPVIKESFNLASEYWYNYKKGLDRGET